VDKMVADGLEEEARSFYSKRHLNSLNTVGYKEWFDFFDGKYSREAAIDKIKQHSRNYARKQLTWFKKDQEIRWINLSDKNIDVEHTVLSALSER
jgi:tRNA dimethylallyltransferase